MSTYKLTYFNGRGRAEIARLIFAAAGVKYEDVRLQGDQWPTLKPSTPFGQVPILEVDGVTLCQSLAIGRFLARKFNLAGKTDLDQARVDMIIDCLEDTTKPLLTFFFEKDEARKETLKKKYLEEQLPTSLTLFEKLLKTNNGGDGFFVGKELTWADLALLVTVGWISLAGADSQLASYPKLDALRKRVEKLPKIAEWIAKRPASDF
jgi:glutathione S-transferase